MNAEQRWRPAKLCIHLAVIYCLLLTSGCAEFVPTPIGANEQIGIPTRAAVVFFVDGVDPLTWERLLSEGRLPSVQRIFIENGCQAKHAVGSIHSVTYANSVSLITGLFPGHHGILGNPWFDRQELCLHDYRSPLTFRRVNNDFTAPTIFDTLEDGLTVSVQAHTRRGVSIAYDNKIAAGLDWCFGEFSRVDARVGRSVGRIARRARREGRWPEIIWCYFPGVDEIGHRYGSESRQYEEELLVVDNAIGTFIADLEEQKLANRTCLALVSDHGHVPFASNRRADLISQLQNVTELRICTSEISGRTQQHRERALGRYDAIALDGSSRHLTLFLRGKSGWRERPSYEEVMNSLTPLFSDAGEWPLQGVCLIATPVCQGKVDIVTPAGAATIERQVINGEKLYRITPSDDCARLMLYLGYENQTDTQPVLPGKWLHSREWLRFTAATPYPDLVVQLIELFDSPNAGEVVFFADAGWSLRGNYNGGHGSICARDLTVPLYFAGAGIEEGSAIPAARTVDLVPTLLDILHNVKDKRTMQPTDGVSLLPTLAP